MRRAQFTKSDNALHESSRVETSEFIWEAMDRAVKRVKRARKWHLVDPLSKAFIKACLMMKLARIKSMQLFKAIIKTIKKLEELVLEDQYTCLNQDMILKWLIGCLKEYFLNEP